MDDLSDAVNSQAEFIQPSPFNYSSKILLVEHSRI